MWMGYDEFADLVGSALDDLPETIHGWLNNIEVVVEDWPTAWQLGQAEVDRGSTLLGLYEGVPLTDRTSHYGMVLPDKVTIFRGPILSFCRTEAAVRHQVRRTVVHELAHHFGISDDRLHELGAY